MKLTDNQETWLTALESGEWKQCHNTMHETRWNSANEAHCCLGVAERLFDGFILKTGDDHLNLLRGGLNECINMNDKEKLSFTEIASTIRSKPEEYFHENKV